MATRTTGQATGLQAAFLIYAVILLAVPVSRLLVHAGSFEGARRILLESGTHFVLAMLVIAIFPALRGFAIDSLARPIPRKKLGEVIIVSIAKLAQAFAAIAAIALWLWLTGGPNAVEQMAIDPDQEAAFAFSSEGSVRLALAVLVAPIVEELAFRGFIYRAFERQWGWLASTIATSALFGIYHSYFWSAFAGSVIAICLLRRAGTLWAPILAHMLFNFMMWWPLLGQHLFPPKAELGDPGAWWFHGTCLVFIATALPVYVWLSCDRNLRQTPG
jgi:uncharacterized protein